MSTDPLQEKYPNISSYAYAAQNPIKYIDPDGKQVGVPYGNMNFNQTRADAYNQVGQKAQNDYVTSKEFRVKVLTEVLSMTDVNDATVIATTITRGSEAINIDGTPATIVDKGFAVGGAFIPFVSGSIVLKGLRKIGKVFGIGEGMQQELLLERELIYCHSKRDRSSN